MLAAKATGVCSKCLNRNDIYLENCEARYVPAGNITSVKRWTNVGNHPHDIESTLKKDWKCKLWINATFQTMKQRWYYVVSLMNHNSTLNRRWNNVEVSSWIDERCIDILSTFGCECWTSVRKMTSEERCRRFNLFLNFNLITTFCAHWDHAVFIMSVIILQPLPIALSCNVGQN